MKIVFCDINPDLVAAWQAYPDRTHNWTTQIEVRHGDIFAQPSTFLVSPANSFGFMDGGIDGVYTRRFGASVQERLQKTLQQSYGELLVGQAIVVDTEDEDFPHIISAPTMRVPMRIVDPIAIYLATRAALWAAKQAIDFQTLNLGTSPKPVTVTFPGMGTMTGQILPELAARLMADAVRDAEHHQFPTSWRQARDEQFRHYRID